MLSAAIAARPWPWSMKREAGGGPLSVDTSTVTLCDATYDDILLWIADLDHGLENRQQRLERGELLLVDEDVGARLG